MKICPTSRAALVAACLATGLLGGCGAWSERNVPYESKPATYSELETKAVRGQAATTATPQTPTSPRKAYELYSKAVQDKDFETCWRLLSRGTQKAYEGEASALRDRIHTTPGPTPEDLELLHVMGLTAKEVDRMDGKTFLVATFRRASARNPQEFEHITRTEFDHEDLWGDQARVYVRADGKREPNPMRLVREGGVWHFELTRPPAPRP